MPISSVISSQVLNFCMQGSEKNAEKETKEVCTRVQPTSLCTTAMDTEATDVAKEPVVVPMDMLPLSVAKESCAVAMDAFPDDGSNEPCTSIIDELPDGVGMKSSTSDIDSLPDAVAKKPSADALPDGDAGNSRTSSIDGVAGELLGNYTVAFDALLTDSSNETCPVAGSVVSHELVTPVAGDASVDDLDSSRNAGLRGLIRTCIDNVGCGSDGETECPHNRRECGKDSPMCVSGEGCGRVEGVMCGVSNGPCTAGHQEKEPIDLCVDDSRTEDACGVHGACQRGESSHCDADMDCDGAAFGTGGRCHSTGVMSCGGDMSAQPCGISDVSTDASVGPAATSPHCTGGSTGSPGCDSRSVAQKTETSDSCRGETDVVSRESCLKGNCENKEADSVTDVTQGCEEACTKTVNCCECETECCSTAKTGAGLPSTLEINIGHGSLGANLLEHVMSPCSSSTLTAPDVSPLMDTDSQEEFNECVPSEECVLPKREPVSDRLGMKGNKEKKEEEEKLPRDLGGVRMKLAEKGYDSIVSIQYC